MGKVVVTPQIKIEEYFNSDALSQSRLKKLAGGIGPFLATKEDDKTLFYEEKDSFVIGSAVDFLLTGETEKFKDIYYVSTLEAKPSDVEMSILNRVFADVLADFEAGVAMATLDKYPKFLAAAIVEEDWYGGKPGEKRTQGLITKGEKYFEDLKNSVGKQILSGAQKKQIDDIVFSLKSNKRTEKYFNRKAFEKIDANITIYYQLPIFFYIGSIYCKALLDILIVERDEEDNVITVHPIDLKTMFGNTLKFSSSVKSWRYDIQAAWYVNAILSTNSTFSNQLKGLKPEMVKPFKFVVESSSYPGTPLVYVIDEEVAYVGRYGKKDLYIKTPQHEYKELVVKGWKGFEDFLEIFRYQEEHGWKEDYVIEKHDGVLTLGFNGIIE